MKIKVFEETINKYRVIIKGRTPLLMNRPPEIYEFDGIKVKNPNIDKEKEIKEKLYVHNKKIFTPCEHIKASLIEAGKDIKVKGKGRSTYSKMFGGMVEITPSKIFHNDSIELDVLASRVVNPFTKGAQVVRRPMLKNWSLDFTVLCEDEIPEDALYEGLTRAGKFQGIGAWRPALKGTYGKFFVSKFEKIK